MAFRERGPEDPKPVSEVGYARPTTRARILVALLLMAVSLAILGWQVSKAGPAEVARRVIESSPGWLLLAAGLTAARFLVFALRLSAITRRIVPCTFSGFLTIVMASQFVGLLLPGLRAGSAFLRAHLASRRFGQRVAVHLGPNILDQLGQATAWLFVAAALLPFSLRGGSTAVSGRIAAIVLVAAIAIAIGGLALRRIGPRLKSWLEIPRPGRRGRIALASSTTLDGTRTLAFDKRAVVAGLAGGMAFLIASGAAQHFSLYAVGYPMPLWAPLLAVTMGSAAGTMAHTPGGLGVTEAAQVAFLSAQGAPPEAAASGVLLARGLHYFVVISLGGPALAWEWHRGRLTDIFRRGRSGQSTQDGEVSSGSEEELKISGMR